MVLPLAMFLWSTLPFSLCYLRSHFDGISACECEAVVWCQEEVKGKQMRGIFQLQHQLARYEDHIDGVDNPGHMQTHNNAVVKLG